MDLAPLLEPPQVFRVEHCGDAYMAVSGHDGAKDHVKRVMTLAQDMLSATQVRGSCQLCPISLWNEGVGQVMAHAATSCGVKLWCLGLCRPQPADSIMHTFVHGACFKGPESARPAATCVAGLHHGPAPSQHNPCVSHRPPIGLCRA